MKVVMKVVVKVVIKVVGKGSDEGGELFILSCLRNFKDDCRVAFATEKHLKDVK